MVVQLLAGTSDMNFHPAFNSMRVMVLLGDTVGCLFQRCYTDEMLRGDDGLLSLRWPDAVGVLTLVNITMRIRYWYVKD